MTFDDSVRYQESHEWARLDGDVVTVGISDYAQDELGDVVFVELPSVGAQMKKGATFGVVESVKAASDLYAPCSGEVVEINDTLKETPETVNGAPFGDGWMIRIRTTSPADLDGLMDSGAYRSFTEGL